MRDSCLFCVRKHLSQAWVLRGECAQGYPHHRALVIGHLAEAADEAAQKFPALAAAIRQERLTYEKDKRYCPDFKALMGRLEHSLRQEGLDGFGEVPAPSTLLFWIGALALGVFWWKKR